MVKSKKYDDMIWRDTAVMKRRVQIVFLVLFLFLIQSIFAGTVFAKISVSDAAHWMYYESNVTGKDTDVFFICPTAVVTGVNADIEDEQTRAAILNATNMEIGIYNKNARVFAPYYEMATLEDYSVGGEQCKTALDTAYKDLRETFRYYLLNENNGRPIVLAGFSEGADMIYRLLQDEFTNSWTARKLVAAYAIGWPCTKDMAEKYPQLKAAKGESDVGVIVSFECESPELAESLIVPKGVKMMSINPLNWKTDGTHADKKLNKGYVQADGNANIKAEIPNLCGAYLDSERGTLKVMDVIPKEYPALLGFLPEGSYHIYDYMFFYRNLQENVLKRIDAWKEIHGQIK